MDLLDRLGVERAVNASGRMTKIGVNTLTPEVIDSMALGGAHYMSIDALQIAAGREIARLIGAEDAMVTTGAAAGICHMVAAVIAGTDLRRVQALPDPLDAPSEILILAGHQVDFGAPVTQMIRLAGGKPTPVGTIDAVSTDQLAAAIGPNAAAFLFVQSHHTKGASLPLDRCIEICGRSGLPVLIDAAAEEDLARYTGSGAHLVAFSGGKAIGGPTSGIVAGRADLVAACRAQSRGIGRPMKIGKEGILGLLAALAGYLDRDVERERIRNGEIVDRLLAGFAGVGEPKRLIDEAGRGIERAGIQLDPETAAALARHLESGHPPIYTRLNQLASGMVAFDPRPLAEDDVDLVIARVREFWTARH